MAVEGGENKKRRITAGVAVGLIVAGVFIFGFGREYLRNKAIEKEIARLEAENSRLEGKKLEFLSLVNDLSSEYYLEGEARTKDGLARPGETMLIIDNSSERQIDNSGQVLGASTADPGISNVTSWLYYFFDRAKFRDMQEL